MVRESYKVTCIITIPNRLCTTNGQTGLCVYCYVLSGSRIMLLPRRGKISLRSLTQKFIRYYTFKVVVGRKKQSMKTESLALAGQRKNNMS